jgi:RNA polymerase sigma factor (TIGR02999 family)
MADFDDPTDPPVSESEVTELLEEWRRGEPDALARLMPVVIEELRHLAGVHFRGEPSGHTLQPTAVVNELYLKLVEQKRVPQNRVHFFAMAARLIRRILVDHARRRGTQKRGGDVPRVALEDAILRVEERASELVALDLALEELAELDPEQAKIFELRAFTGLTLEEIAELLGISRTTVNRKLKTAKVWLRRELSRA